MKQVIKQILETRKNAPILIASHINSDLDAIGSSMGLCAGLKKLGYTNVKVLLNESGKIIFDKTKSFISDIDYSCDKNLPCELFVALDLNSEDRLGEFSETFKNSNRSVLIDHHINPQIKTTATYSIPEYSSTCELVFNILNKLNALDKTSATMLYVGMRADTLDFKVMVTPSTLYAASKCLEFGFDANLVISKTELKNTDAEFNVFTKAYNKTKCEDGLKVVVLEEDDLVKNNISLSVAKKKAIDIYYSIEGIKLLCVIINTKLKRMGSFRSYCDLTVNTLAEELGGGGHAKACGFVTEQPLNEVVDKVKTYYKKNRN